MTDLERYVADHIEQDGDCWIWTGPVTTSGQTPTTSPCRATSGRMLGIRPLMTGGKPRTRWVPSCGQHLCVNPEHLVPKRKPRRPGPGPRFGEGCWSAVLTEADVLELRRRYVPRARGHRGHDPGLSPGSFQALAQEFGVAVMTAHRAITGRTWAHLPGAKTAADA